MPYINYKLENQLNKYADANQTPPQNIKFLSNVFTTLKSIWEFTKLTFYIRYLSNKTFTYSPMLKICQLSLQYPTQIEELEWSWTDMVKGKVRIAHIMSSFIFKGLELSAFFLQFLQWWQTQSHKSSIGNIIIPEPPDILYSGKRYGNLCPICLQKWQIPTVVQISGFIYCYKCILNYIEKYKVCPITKYPVSIDKLVTIYDA